MKISTLIGIALWAMIPGFIAKKKYRSFWGYYFLSFLISPLITTIIALCVSDKTYEYPSKNPPPSYHSPGNQETLSINPSRSNLPIAGNRILFCRKCGEKLIANSQFCHKCGSKTGILYENSDHTPPVASREPNTIWICEKCKAKNLGTRNDCWSCGSPK
ncbi:MAG: zinc ribbon domain-containing protein [Oscillospiraceae bacterium]|nr:zinc ribbon domain-containing protein [Oscillospiraceae bacterium]